LLAASIPVLVISAGMVVAMVGSVVVRWLAR
jgi:hypothetical protein